MVVAFTDLKQAGNTRRKNLSPLLDFHFLGSEPDMIEIGRVNPASPIQLTKDPSEAEYFVLPKHWTCYLWNRKRDFAEALKMAELADRYGKPLIIWFKGDLVPRIPFDNYLVFLPGIVRSSQKERQVACPVFVDDPLPKYGTANETVRQKGDMPTLGFCGYASAGVVKTSWSVINGVGLKLREKLGQGDYESVPILPSTFLRSRALEAAMRSKSIKTDFLIRRSYTPNTPAVMRSQNGEARLAAFFTGVYGNDYTLCMRGYGNWSYRFYETLACGRIPVFLDTDCVLPLENGIDWKKYCVWVDRSEVSLIGEKIADFHAELSESDFLDLQRACRKLWENRLTLSGFINDFHRYLI